MELDEGALEQLKALIGNDTEALGELIDSFLDDGESLVASMQSADQEQNTDLLRRSAHTLKSGAAEFGAMHLSTLCATLETACQTGWPDSASDQISSITATYAQSSEALRLYQGTLHS